MQEKDIKRHVTKQLKKEFPRFHRLTKKQKKVLVGKVISEVMASYKPVQAMHVPIHELTKTPATTAPRQNPSPQTTKILTGAGSYAKLLYRRAIPGESFVFCSAGQTNQNQRRW